jgi:hypothetical protein
VFDSPEVLKQLHKPYCAVNVESEAEILPRKLGIVWEEPPLAVLQNMDLLPSSTPFFTVTIFDLEEVESQLRTLKQNSFQGMDLVEIDYGTNDDDLAIRFLSRYHPIHTVLCQGDQLVTLPGTLLDDAERATEILVKSNHIKQAVSVRCGIFTCKFSISPEELAHWEIIQIDGDMPTAIYDLFQKQLDQNSIYARFAVQGNFHGADLTARRN